MSTEPKTDEVMTEDQDMDAEGEYNEEEYEEEYGEGDDDLFGDEDADEEAEAVAKRLGDALWADISKAYAQQGTAQPFLVSQPSDIQNHMSSPGPPSPSLSEEGDDGHSLANAIQTVLDFAAGHTSLYEVLSGTLVSGAQDQTLLHVLTQAAGAKTVAPELADALGDLIQSIADGQLFKASRKATASDRRNQEAEENGDGAPGTLRSPSWD